MGEDEGEKKRNESVNEGSSQAVPLRIADNVAFLSRKLRDSKPGKSASSSPSFKDPQSVPTEDERKRRIRGLRPKWFPFRFIPALHSRPTILQNKTPGTRDLSTVCVSEEVSLSSKS